MIIWRVKPVNASAAVQPAMRQRTTTRVLALDDGADGGSVETAVDDVAFPMTRQQSFLDFLRAMQVDSIGRRNTYP